VVVLWFRLQLLVVVLWFRLQLLVVVVVVLWFRLQLMIVAQGDLSYYYLCPRSPRVLNFLNRAWSLKKILDKCLLEVSPTKRRLPRQG
jgi:hypothetical protein